ncbi:MAG: hypothetical protein CSB46_04715 [Micrococcales bacterium]|nr:MAG: hypothetical protein CSB46_04715 [Micrococcales bacterium]
MLTYAGLLQSMGMFDVINRTTKDPDRFCRTMATATAAIGTVFAAATYFFSEPLARLLGDEQIAPLLRIVAFAFPVMAYAGIQLALITRRLDFRLRVLSDGGSAIVGTAVSVTLMVLGYGAPGALIGVVVTYVCAPIIGWLAGVRIVPGWVRADASEAWHWVRVAGPGIVLGTAMLSLDYVVLGQIRGSAETGIYGLGYRFAYLPFLALALVLAGVAFPIFSHLYRSGEFPRLVAAIREYSAVMAAGLFGVYSILFGVAPFLQILGTQWEGSVAALRVLCLYGALLCLGLVPLDALRALGHKERFLAAQVTHFAVLTATLIWWTSQWGLIGTAWAQVFSAGISLILSYGLLLTVIPVRLWSLLRQVSGPVAASALVVGAVLVIEALVGYDPTSLAIGLVLGCGYLGLYAGALFLISPDLAARLLRILRRRQAG